MEKLTPMMQQYMEIKNRHQDCILFFRLGDFYEMFFDDAIIASKELEITLTERGVGLDEKAAMCGVPHHVADNYVAKLVEKGYKVAICEQVEDPKDAKGIVKRDVVKLITPGTATNQSLLDEKSNNYLAAIYLGSFSMGLAYVDNSTGELYSTYFKDSREEMLSFAINELSKINPREIICNPGFLEDKKTHSTIKNTLNPYINIYEDDKIGNLNLHDVFYTSLKEDLADRLIRRENLESKLATAILIEYLGHTQKTSLDHINDIVFYQANSYMILDFSTRTNLEIDETIISKDKKGSILGFMDKTSTSMGGRLLKKWLDQPLINKYEIEKRNGSVEFFVDNPYIRDKILEILNKIYDIERLSSRISSGNCNGRDLVSLKNSIKRLPELKLILKETEHDNLVDYANKIDSLEDIYTLIDQAIVDSPPITITEGSLIKKGFDNDLDEIRNIATRGKEWLADLEAREREASGINNLKIGYNKMLGYYFEITKANISKAPEHFIRRQTLTNSERYFTEELKEMENKILNAEENLLNFEYEIFIKIRESIKLEVERIQASSRYISEIDVLTSFAKTAYESNFVKPSINDEGIIDIRAGRHPVVENNIDANLFVPNDTYLDLDSNMIQIITGPNMAGKSTYMRQVAIIALLTQIGSFVPADSANMSILDRIFTRIGAADNLSQGQSTFMVEMNEVANIVKSATSQSLIILDEVGRGTSTYDGLSIAWALVEHLAKDIRAKTLFATHYHELTDLAEEYDEIKNLTILAEEKGRDIVFLRKVVEGSTNKSYGIQVARLAGIDDSIINRANELLYSIEKSNHIDLDQVQETQVQQMDLDGYRKEAFLENIASIDPDDISAREALDLVYNLVEEAENIRSADND